MNVNALYSYYSILRTVKLVGVTAAAAAAAGVSHAAVLAYLARQQSVRTAVASSNERKKENEKKGMDL